MKRLLALFLALSLAACSTTGANERQAFAGTSIEVLRSGDVWTADFRFDRDSPVWAFTRSAVTREGQRPWRPRSWTVETSGVRLERQGRYDVLVAENGRPVPRRVRIRFTPFAQDLIAAYDPALVFTDGSVALYTQQFDPFPVASTAIAAALPIDLADAQVEQVPTRVRFRDRRGRVLHMGRRYDSATITGGGGAYLLFGPAAAIENEAMATIIDPQLPAWLRSTLASATPRILAAYAERLGPAPGGRPTFLLSWAGPTPRLSSMGGSVLPSMVVMRFEGEGVVRESPQLAHQALWFIAHEGAHFWLGQAVGYQFSRDAWITEGGADLLAIRNTALLDPSYDARAALQERLERCVRIAAGRSVASAQQRNEHDAYYACGAMFGLIAEGAQRRSTGGDFFAFVRALIDSNREDRVVTKDEWLAQVTRLAGDPALEQGMRAMIETGVADPSAHLQSLFARAGIGHARDSEGRLRLQ